MGSNTNTTFGAGNMGVAVGVNNGSINFQCTFVDCPIDLSWEYPHILTFQRTAPTTQIEFVSKVYVALIP